jgi:thiol-disulfide isomerase/thioredoxin
MSRLAVIVTAGLLALGLGALALRPAAAAEDDYSLDLVELQSGEEVTFEDLCQTRPLVIHVWAPDCPHCRVHMPYVAALYEKLDLSTVNFLTLSVTGDEEEIEDYLEERELDFPVLWGASGDYGEAWEELGWPTTYVFASGGEYVGWCDILGPAYVSDMQELVEEAKSLGYAENELGLDDLRHKSSRSRSGDG